MIYDVLRSVPTDPWDEMDPDGPIGPGTGTPGPGPTKRLKGRICLDICGGSVSDASWET